MTNEKKTLDTEGITTDNMCDFCLKTIQECKGNPDFGTGTGNDNVVACDGFQSLGKK